MSAELVEVTVEEIAAGGDGLARLESGRVVFVPRTAPGDRVVARLTDDRARWARGQVVEWKTRAPERVRPQCTYFESCGGCAVQHLDAAMQAHALRSSLVETLRRIGEVEPTVGPIEPSSRRFGYRNRVTFTLRRSAGRVTAGYHRLRGPRLIDVLSCPLAEPPIQEAWTALRGAWGPKASALPSGRELRLTLRASRSGRVALWVSGGAEAGEPGKLLEAVPSLTSYWWSPTGAERRHLGGEAHFFDEWDGRRVPLRPEAFLQVNREVARQIDAHLTIGLGSVGGRRVLDLYGGVGLRALALARAGAEVTLVEAGRDAVETARHMIGLSAADVSVRHARVEDVIDEVLPADVVLVNPPRAGLSHLVCERLTKAVAGRLVYVSCDPATLGRDAKRLAGGWRLASAQPFDAFPQTGHVETVAWFERVAP